MRPDHSESVANYIDLDRTGMYCTCGAGEFKSYNGLAKHVLASRKREQRERAEWLERKAPVYALGRPLVYIL